MSSHTSARVALPRPTRPSQTRPSRPRRPSGTGRRILAVTSLGLAGLIAGLLSGCAPGVSNTTSASVNPFANASGNWQFNSTAAAARRLPTVGGSLSINGVNVSGNLHPLHVSGPQCLPAATVLAVTGRIDSASHLTLSAPLPGGTLSLSGTLAVDGRSLSDPTYTVTGGDCAAPAAQTAAQTAFARDTPPNAKPQVTAQQFQPLGGTYTGTLTTADGETFSLSSNLTQTSQPDADGVYHVSGSAISPGNPCVPSALLATASTIDGGSVSTTYTDAATGTTITGAGSSSPDASTITISSWTITSPCGQDSGSGTLTRQ